MLQVPLSQPRPFYESPLSVVERFQKIQLYENEAGELRLKRSKDYPEAVEEHKKEWRNSWAGSRLNRMHIYICMYACMYMFSIHV